MNLPSHAHTAIHPRGDAIVKVQPYGDGHLGAVEVGAGFGVVDDLMNIGLLGGDVHADTSETSRSASTSAGSWYSYTGAGPTS